MIAVDTKQSLNQNQRFILPGSSVSMMHMIHVHVSFIFNNR